MALPTWSLSTTATSSSTSGSEMRRIADALGITVDDAAWASLVRAAEFDAMRSRADELVPEVHVPGVWHDNQEFFHTGTSGQWRTLLSDTDLARYQQRLDELDIASDFRGLASRRPPPERARPAAVTTPAVKVRTRPARSPTDRSAYENIRQIRIPGSDEPGV